MFRRFCAAAVTTSRVMLKRHRLGGVELRLRVRGASGLNRTTAHGLYSVRGLCSRVQQLLQLKPSAAGGS
jgi:hypothetical protein